jgi:hypothetical protein
MATVHILYVLQLYNVHNAKRTFFAYKPYRPNRRQRKINEYASRSSNITHTGTVLICNAENTGELCCIIFFLNITKHNRPVFSWKKNLQHRMYILSFSHAYNNKDKVYRTQYLKFNYNVCCKALPSDHHIWLLYIEITNNKKGSPVHVAPACAGWLWKLNS